MRRVDWFEGIVVEADVLYVFIYIDPQWDNVYSKDVNRDQQNSNKGGDQLIGQQLN